VGVFFLNTVYVQVTYNQGSQKSAMSVSLILANAHKKTTSRGLVQFLVTVTHKKNQNVRKGTYGRTFVKLVMHLKQT